MGPPCLEKRKKKKKKTTKKTKNTSLFFKETMHARACLSMCTTNAYVMSWLSTRRGLQAVDSLFFTKEAPKNNNRILFRKVCGCCFLGKNSIIYNIVWKKSSGKFQKIRKNPEKWACADCAAP